VREFLTAEKVDVEVQQQMEAYLSFLSKRADGTFLTNAAWIRKFVTSHMLYNQDSLVGNALTFNLMKTIEKIQRQEMKVPEMYGDFW